MGYYSNKIAWITGASSGIGEEFAHQLAKEGATLILSARSVDKLEKLKNTLPGSNHMVLPLDLVEYGNFPELAAQVIQHFGRIDLLVNNGGLSQRSKTVETSLDIDHYIMNVNYFGNIALTKAVLPYFQKQGGGQIITISSVAGKFGFYLRSAYAASKSAVIGFYESLAIEEEDNGIKVTIAVPGKINTPISMSALNSKGEKHGVMDHNQETGMSAEDCVRKILKAAEKNKREVLVGNREILGVYLKRFLPQRLFWKIMKKQSAT